MVKHVLGFFLCLGKKNTLYIFLVKFLRKVILL